MNLTESEASRLNLTDRQRDALGLLLPSPRQSKKTTRRKAVCMNCRETREHYAHGLCARCLRREDRKMERQMDRWENREKSYPTPGISKEQKKLVSAHARLVSALGDMGVSQEDITAIRATLRPYLEPVADYVANEPMRKVNSEQNPATNVHRSPADEAKPECTAVPVRPVAAMPVEWDPEA